MSFLTLSRRLSLFSSLILVLALLATGLGVTAHWMPTSAGSTGRLTENFPSATQTINPLLIPYEVDIETDNDASTFRHEVYLPGLAPIPMSSLGERSYDLANGILPSYGLVFEASQYPTYPFGIRDRPRNVTLLHPGTFSTAALGSSVAYTIPQDGTYQIEGTFARANVNQGYGDGVEVMVFRNLEHSMPLFQQTISANHAVDPSNYFGGTGKASFSFTRRLTKNEVLRFVVFSGTSRSDGTFDMTAFKVKLTPCFSDEAFPAGGQTFEVKSGNPTLIPIKGLHANDTVYIEATLHDAKPGKNQQNRPLILQSSRGFSARVDNYELPTAFTYEMKADCEIFKAYIQNADQTELATIKVRLKRKQRLSQASRNSLSTLSVRGLAANSQFGIAIGNGGSGGSGGSSGGGGPVVINTPLCGEVSPEFEPFETRPAGGDTFSYVSSAINAVDSQGVIESRPGTRIGDWQIRFSGSVQTVVADVYTKVSKGLSVGDQVRVSGRQNNGTIQAYELRFISGTTVCRRSLGNQIRGTTSVTANAVNTLSLDPPDPNFTAIAQPEIPETNRLQAKESLLSDPAQRQRIAAVVKSYNAFIENQLFSIAYARAMYTAMNRADGALEANDTFWESRQVQVMERYQTQVAYLLSLQPTLRVTLHQTLIAAGIIPLPVTTDDILRDQTDVANNGLPILFTETLEELGADSALIEMIRAQFIVQKQDAATGFPDNLIQPDLIEALRNAAQALLPARFLNSNGSIIKTNIGLNMNVSALSVKPGNNLTYTLTVENFGPETATNVTFTAELPSNADFVSVAPSQGQCNKQGNSLTCEIPSMNKGTRSEIQIIVRPMAEGTITTTFHVVAAQPDNDLFNNSAESNVFSSLVNTPVGQNVCLNFGSVRVCFTNVSVAGDTTVIPIQAASAGSLLNGYSLNGLNIAFDISTTAIFSGPVTVSLNNLPVTASETFSRLRILHGENGQLVDRTILIPDSPAPDFVSKEISARVTSLSPFVVALAPLPPQPIVAGSVLVFPLYTSTIGNAAVNTRLNFTNIDPTRIAYVHVFFISNQDCTVADTTLCLTPNQTASFLASDFDPGTTGYVIAVAVDAQGCPINFNNLIGSEFVKLASGHAASFEAQAIAALRTGVFACNPAESATTLKFDGVQYSLLPHTLAANNVPSPLEGNDTLLILNRISGDLNDGAADRLRNLAGLVYNDREIGYSFVQSAGQCQLIQRLNNGFPRTSPPLGQIIPVGRTGWLRFNQTDNGAMIGAMINLNPKGFNQGHYLHVLRFTSATLTIPVYAPSCVQ